MIQSRYGVFLLLISTSLTYSFTGKSFLTYRSQGSYPSYSNLDHHTSLYKDSFCNAEAVVSYSQSFNADSINSYLFGCKNLVFSGSRNIARKKSDIIADYFGLPTDFKSTVHFSPQIKNITTHFNFFWELDRIHKGLFLQLMMPFTHSNWKLNPCETVINPGSLAYPAGYMSNSRIELDQLKKGALDVLQCQQTFGDLEFPLKYGRITKEKSATKCSDIDASLGYSFEYDNNNMCSVAINLIIPTGTRSEAIYLFEPQIGNGHHWALGAEFSGYYECIQEEDWTITALFKAQLHHFFKTTEKRSYDFKKNGPGSRYMLIEDMTDDLSITLGFSDDLPPSPTVKNIYIKRLLYGTDITTLDSKIQIDVEANILAALHVHHNKWNARLGYNMWARSHEKLVSRERLQYNSYGIKGDAQIYGYLDVGAFVIPIPTNATQSQSTLFAAQGAGNTINNFFNSNADNADLLFNVGGPILQTKADSLSGTGVTSITQVNGSNQSIVITDCDINNRSGLSPAAMTHTFFGEVVYSWDSTIHERYCALGAQAECAPTFDHHKGAVSQWSVWGRLGINY